MAGNYYLMEKIRTAGTITENKMWVMNGKCKTVLSIWMLQHKTRKEATSLQMKNMGISILKWIGKFRRKETAALFFMLMKTLPSTKKLMKQAWKCRFWITEHQQGLGILMENYIHTAPVICTI